MSEREPTQPNFLSVCCGAAPSRLTPNVSADDLTGKCSACHDNTVFEVDLGPVDWRTHTHSASDPPGLQRQHGPNSHTHGPTGSIDTIMGEAYPEPAIRDGNVGWCYNCIASLDPEVDSEFCDDCREKRR